MVAGAVYDFFTVARDSTHDAKFLSLSAQQSLISQSVVRSADDAVAGNTDAFQQLSNASDQFDNTISLMGNGDPQTLMPAATGEVQSELSVLQNQWGQVRSALQGHPHQQGLHRGGQPGCCRRTPDHAGPAQGLGRLR